jgi:hypothetical protein
MRVITGIFSSCRVMDFSARFFIGGCFLTSSTGFIVPTEYGIHMAGTAGSAVDRQCVPDWARG